MKHEKRCIKLKRQKFWKKNKKNFLSSQLLKLKGKKKV